MQVVEPPSYLYDTGEMPLNMPELDARVRADADRALSERVGTSARGCMSLEGTLHVGRPADRLIALTETVDLMVVGSRGYGPLKAVLLGGVSGQLIRSAACPVIVIPRERRRPSARCSARPPWRTPPERDWGGNLPQDGGVHVWPLTRPAPR